MAVCQIRYLVFPNVYKVALTTWMKTAYLEGRIISISGVYLRQKMFLTAFKVVTSKNFEAIFFFIIFL